MNRCRATFDLLDVATVRLRSALLKRSCTDSRDGPRPYKDSCRVKDSIYSSLIRCLNLFVFKKHTEPSSEVLGPLLMTPKRTTSRPEGVEGCCACRRDFLRP